MFSGLAKLLSQPFACINNCNSQESAYSIVTDRGGLGRLAAWHLPGGPVGPPAKLAATSNVEVGQMKVQWVTLSSANTKV